MKPLYPARSLIPLAALVLLAWALPAGAQAPACSDCHSDVAVHSPVHSKLACADCHTAVKVDEDHAEAARKEIASPGFCSNCHADVDLRHSVHQEVSCARCHGKAHDVVPVKDPKSPVAARNQVQTCAQCHKGKYETYRGAGYPAPPLVGALTKLHDWDTLRPIYNQSGPCRLLSRHATPRIFLCSEGANEASCPDWNRFSVFPGTCNRCNATAYSEAQPTLQRDRSSGRIGCAT